MAHTHTQRHLTNTTHEPTSKEHILTLCGHACVLFFASYILLLGRCYIGNLRLILDSALEDEGSQEDKDKVLLVALSKVQQSLRLSTPLSSTDENIQLGVEDCTVLKGAGCLCTKDLKGLSGNLVFVLACENNFTNHAAERTFMALLEYLFEATSLFAFVMNIIWKALRFCFSDPQDAFKKLEFSNMAVSCVCLPGNHRTSTFACKVPMHLLQILHGFLRKTKEEASKFTKYLISSGVYIPEVFLAFSTHFTLSADNPVKHKLEEEDLMLAALLRFLCSFNHSLSMHSDVIDAANFISKSEYLGSANSFLAAFAHPCLNTPHRHRLSHYLRHKYLMLMFRSCEWFIKWPGLAITCFDILKSNMSTLCPSLFQRQAQLSDPSTSSPFAPCFLENNAQFLPSSPEMHAVFLLFKVEASLRKTPCISVSRIKAGSATSGHSTEQQDEHWMLKWLLLHVSMIQNVQDSGHDEVADCLASSFLQIFFDEDPLLLEMLLLLQDSLIPELISRSDADHESFQEAFKLLIEIFKPLRLFAMFLSLISYDHSVLLDFLISKDTGVLCLQYLMRSMRIVKDTWPEILFLSQTSIEHTREDKFKEQLMVDMHTSSMNQAISCRTRIDVIDKLGTCLMNLKHAVKKSYKKHVFPYNPSPLLKQLESFEQLWQGALSLIK